MIRVKTPCDPPLLWLASRFMFPHHHHHLRFHRDLPPLQPYCGCFRLGGLQQIFLFIQVNGHKIIWFVIVIIFMLNRLWVIWLASLINNCFLLTRSLLEVTSANCTSKSTLRACLVQGTPKGRGVSSEGESSHFISLASFNVPSALHASPKGFVVSRWIRVSTWSSRVSRWVGQFKFWHSRHKTYDVGQYSSGMHLFVLLGLEHCQHCYLGLGHVS